MKNDWLIVKPITPEQWIDNGKVCFERTDTENLLYIKPLLQNIGAVRSDVTVRHSLVLDNNVFTDLLQNRYLENNRFLENIVRQNPIELNPILAIIEQRQKYGKATDALKAYAEYLNITFGSSAAKHGVAEFENSLLMHKESLIQNVDLLSGYLSAITYLYHLKGTAEEKLEWLSGLIKSADLPYFQLHFYFAALVFLAKDSPHLFYSKDIQKINKDMKIESTFKGQKEKIMNLSNDLALPTMALFHAGTPVGTIVFPYIVTRDRLVQLFLRELTCKNVEDAGLGRSNGDWRLKDNGLLYKNLGSVIQKYFPYRLGTSTKEDLAIRKVNLKEFENSYLMKSLELKKLMDI